MTLTILNVIYVLLAVAMIGFILVQRGAGAQAGSGFGGGASATVFGSRGAGNFLTKSTAILATLFFLLSLGMGVFISRGGFVGASEDLGVMSGAASTAPAVQTPAPASDVPAVPAATAPAATGDVPAAPAAETPAAAPANGDVPAPAANENSNETAAEKEQQTPQQ